MASKFGNLVWIDLEMTGLDTARDKIIEIATLVTDNELNIIATGPNLAIHQPDSVLDKMDAWNQQQHGESGLIQRVRQSTISVEEAERQTLEFLKIYTEPKSSPMCGNSVCQDRRFLHRDMLALESFFHYRHIDVSTIKELAMRWMPETFSRFKKHNNHLALDDIRESVNELKYYRTHVFTSHE